MQKIKALTMFIATLILLLTRKYNGFNAGQTFVLIIFLAYIQSIRLLEEIAAINFPMVFMIAALLFSYETGSEMLLYSYGFVSMKNFIKGLVVRSAVLFASMFAIFLGSKS